MYEYGAAVLAVIDGDTLELDIDLGCDVHVHQRVRLKGCNAPEHDTEAGKAAARYVAAWVAQFYGHGTVTTTKTKAGSDEREKYGRLLGDLVEPGGRSLVADLIAEGYALPWDGKGQRPT